MPNGTPDAATTFEVTDFRMAGFLLARGAKFTGTTVNPKQEVVFLFDNRPNGGMTASDLLNEYPGSAEQKYDAACRTMHDFVKMTVPKYKGRGDR